MSEEKKSEIKKEYIKPSVKTEELDTGILMVQACNGMTGGGRKDTVGPCDAGAIKT